MTGPMSPMSPMSLAGSSHFSVCPPAPSSGLGEDSLAQSPPKPPTFPGSELVSKLPLLGDVSLPCLVNQLRASHLHRPSLFPKESLTYLSLPCQAWAQPSSEPHRPQELGPLLKAPCVQTVPVSPVAIKVQCRLLHGWKTKKHGESDQTQQVGDIPGRLL